MLTHRICVGVIGSTACAPNTIGSSIIAASPPLVGSIWTITFFRFS
jgi:hypothetical protein